MTIKCKECGQEFKNMITNTHLKRHNMTTHDYKKKHGEDSLICDEYRKERSLKYSGKNNPMYGRGHTEETRKKQSKIAKQKGHGSHLPGVNGQPFTEEHKKNLREGIQRREEKYELGELIRPEPCERTPELRKRISESVKKYAEENKEKLSERGKKAYQTKVNNGNWENPYDLMIKNDKDGSAYDSWKTKTKKGLKKAQKNRINLLWEKTKKLIDNNNLTLLSSDRTNYDRDILYLRCNTCGAEFHFSRNLFVSYKSKEKNGGCPCCNPKTIYRSIAEQEIYDFVKSTLTSDITVLNNSRYILGTSEIDIFIPILNLGIEFNGLYWHSEEVLASANKKKDADYQKMLNLAAKGIRLISIFEDEWAYKQDIVKSMIRHRLGVTSNILYARKCYVSELPPKEANAFLKKNHIQGVGRSNIRYGLFCGNDLVSVMTFSESNISRKIKGWEIDRFCTKLDTCIVGAGSKLFKRFIKNHDPEQVISFADKRWSDGQLYETLGFEWLYNTPLNYWYFKPNELVRKHRFGLRKNKDDDPNLTEYENRLKQGYLRIWDCGSSKWIWTKK